MAKTSQSSKKNATLDHSGAIFVVLIDEAHQADSASLDNLEEDENQFFGLLIKRSNQDAGAN
jgi:hypothetical protein